MLGIISMGKDWLAQCQDNVTEWDIRSWVLVTWYPIEKALYGHHGCALSQVCAHSDMTLDVASKTPTTNLDA